MPLRERREERGQSAQRGEGQQQAGHQGQNQVAHRELRPAALDLLQQHPALLDDHHACNSHGTAQPDRRQPLGDPAHDFAVVRQPITIAGNAQHARRCRNAIEEALCQRVGQDRDLGHHPSINFRSSATT